MQSGRHLADEEQAMGPLHSQMFVLTGDAREALADEEVAEGFREHVTGQGDIIVLKHMVRTTDLRHRLRLTSEHQTKDGKRFRIATEFGLSTTEVSLVEED